MKLKFLCGLFWIWWKTQTGDTVKWHFRYCSGIKSGTEEERTPSIYWFNRRNLYESNIRTSNIFLIGRIVVCFQFLFSQMSLWLSSCWSFLLVLFDSDSCQGCQSRYRSFFFFVILCVWKNKNKIGRILLKSNECFFSWGRRSFRIDL